MKMYLVPFLAAVFALSPLSGVAGEKQVADVKELAGSWRGWVTGEQGQERATMIVSPDGSYKATTTRGSTAEGEFSLRDGETLGRQRQDHAHGEPGGPQLPDRHRRIRTGEVASYGVQTTNEDLSAVSRVSLPASMVISVVAGGSD